MKELTERDKGFVQGFSAACAIAMSSHDCETIVADTYKCNYHTIDSLRMHDVDEFDISILKPIIKEIERKRKL